MRRRRRGENDTLGQKPLSLASPCFSCSSSPLNYPLPAHLISSDSHQELISPISIKSLFSLPPAFSPRSE
eukprot:scaffold56310_cov26-Tisochrysis_lutea.AAC.1